MQASWASYQIHLNLTLQLQNKLNAIFCVGKNHGMERFLICTENNLSFYLCLYTSLLSIREDLKLIFTSTFQRKSPQELD